jgi:hypothetical protein
MIIRLHRDFRLLEEAAWAGYHAELKNILQAHRAGMHIFMLERGEIDCLHGMAFLDNIDKETLLLMKRKFQNYTSAARSCSKSIILYDHRVGHAPGNEEHHIYIDIKNIISHEALGRCRIVLENVRYDAFILSRLFEAVADFNGWPKPRLKKINGGGAAIGAAIDAEASDSGPLICIYDTDKRSPTAPMGDTARIVKEAIDRNKLLERKNFIAIPLPAREMENLIPMAVIERLEPANCLPLKRISTGWPNLTESEKNLLAYYDTKEDCDLTNISFFHSRDDENHLRLLRARVGGIARKVSNSLSIEYYKKVTAQNMPQRDIVALEKCFVDEFKRSPFFDVITTIYRDVMTLASHDVELKIF